MHTLRRQNKLFASANVAYADRFRAGFTHCAAEVSQFLNKIDQNANAHLMRHLRDCIQRVEPPTGPPSLPPPLPPPQPPQSQQPSSVASVMRMSSPPIAIDVPQPYYPIGTVAALAAATATKMNQKVADLPIGSTNNNNNNTTINNNNNNNNYLTTSYNHHTSSPNGIQHDNDPDNRPVLIKQSISPMMLNKDDPREQLNGDVWRPW